MEKFSPGWFVAVHATVSLGYTIGRVSSHMQLQHYASSCASGVCYVSLMQSTFPQIPFIAMLRKAVVMPKWAIAYTVGLAVLGQIMGARLERQRLQGDRPLLLSALPATGKRVSTAISATASAQPRSCRLDLMSLVGTSAPAIAVL